LCPHVLKTARLESIFPKNELLGQRCDSPLVSRLGTQLAESVAAVREAIRNPDLRRLQIALASLVVGQWTYTVAVAVYAYQHGGAAAVGLVGLIRMLPSAFAAPITAFFADRYPRRRVLVLATLAEALGVALTAAAVLAGAPNLLVYGITAIVQVATTAAVPTRAAHACARAHACRTHGREHRGHDDR
jgi:hypothetical protein